MSIGTSAGSSDGADDVDGPTRLRASRELSIDKSDSFALHRSALRRRSCGAKGIDRHGSTLRNGLGGGVDKDADLLIGSFTQNEISLPIAIEIDGANIERIAA